MQNVAPASTVAPHVGQFPGVTGGGAAGAGFAGADGGAVGHAQAGGGGTARYKVASPASRRRRVFA